jgi:hypothetical protein
VILVNRRLGRRRHRHRRLWRIPAAGRAELVRGGALRSVVLRDLLAVLVDSDGLARAIPDGRNGRGDVHGALGDWGVRYYRAARDGNCGGGAAVAHEVDGARGVFVPEIDHQDEVGAVDVVGVDFLARSRVAHDEPDAGWWSNGAAVL